MKCPVTGVNIVRFVMSILAGFVCIFGFDFLVHGILLAETYQETVHLWRPMEEMQNYMPLTMGVQFAYAVILAFIFTRHYEGKGIVEGVRFGVMMGALVGVLQISAYAYMPISLFLGLAWSGAYLVQAIIVGIVFSLLYRS